MKNMFGYSVAAFLSLSCASGFGAEDNVDNVLWTLKLSEATVANNTRYISLTNAYLWVNGNEKSGADGDPLSPDKDYAIGGSALVYTFTNATTVFKGRSLRLGRVRHQSFGDYVTSWDNWGEGDGLTVGTTENGYYVAYSGSNEAEIYGKVRIASTNAAPFIFGSDYSNAVLDFHGDFSGGNENAFAVLGINRGSKNWVDGFCLKMSGSLTNYFGSIFVTNAMLSVDSTTLPGNMAVGSKGVLTTQASDDVFTADTISFGSGSGIKVNASIIPSDLASSTNGVIIVTNSLIVADNVVVTVDESIWDDLASSVNIPILVAPDTAQIHPGMFVMNPDFPSAAAGTRLDLVRDETGGVVTLVATMAPVVKNVSSSKTSILESEYWTDKKAPHENAHYVMQKIGSDRNDAITPTDKNASYVFPGASFTIGSGCLFEQFYGTVSFSELRLRHGAIYLLGNSVSEGVLNGRVVLPDGANDHASICAYNTARFNIAADIVGSSRIVIDGRHNSTGSRAAITRFTGSNSRFFGTITVGLNRDPLIISSNMYQRLVVSDPTKLGRSLAEFSPTALVLKRLAMLCAEGDVEFWDTTRGIYIGEDGSEKGSQATATMGTSSEAQMYADEGNTLAVRTQLTLNGRLHKYGLGTLALGGPLKFGPAASILEEPVAFSNYLAVAEGWIKPLAADSFNGMEITFASGTGVRFDIDPADEGLKAYGLRNTKTDLPFAAAGGTFKVAFDVPEDFIPGKTITVNLLTVESDKVEGIMNMLEVVNPRILNYKTFLNVVSNGDVSTISATFKPVGLVFTVR